MRERADTVLVLDLDDTLYHEHDYVASGRAHVAELIARTFGRDVRAAIGAFVAAEPNGDLWLHLARELGQPDSVKEQFLWAYRLHPPVIALAPSTGVWLDRARKSYAMVAILTDGRALTQRLKLTALGIADLPVYISEEWGADKPDPRRFEAIMQRFQCRRYVYIGDNPAKDFRAPNALGWLTIGLEGDGRNIQAQRRDFGPPDGPSHWISRLADADVLVDGVHS
jgi:putative hydrolase of the HAD superfamily